MHKIASINFNHYNLKIEIKIICLIQTLYKILKIQCYLIIGYFEDDE